MARRESDSASQRRASGAGATSRRSEGSSTGAGVGARQDWDGLTPEQEVVVAALQAGLPSFFGDLRESISFHPPIPSAYS